jgi:hypothetical protein
VLCTLGFRDPIHPVAPLTLCARQITDLKRFCLIQFPDRNKLVVCASHYAGTHKQHSKGSTRGTSRADFNQTHSSIQVLQKSLGAGDPPKVDRLDVAGGLDPGLSEPGS